MSELAKKNEIFENLVISLEPKEKFIWGEEIYFEFSTVDTKRIWQGISWMEFRSRSDSYWFWFEYDLPFEMQSLKSKLFENFPDSWRTAGEIPIARYQIKDISGQKMLLETAPIFIDFSQANLKESEDNDTRKVA